MFRHPATNHASGQIIYTAANLRGVHVGVQIMHIAR
jgi:hypothetical protein